jgi:hypothetical protein
MNQVLSQDETWYVPNCKPEYLEILSRADQSWKHALERGIVELEPVVECAKMLKYLGISMRSFADCETMLKYLGVDAFNANLELMLMCLDK